jgi:hypothetical protein
MLDYLLPGLAIAYPAGDRVLRIRDAQCELIDPQRGRCGDAAGRGCPAPLYRAVQTTVVPRGRLR